MQRFGACAVACNSIRAVSTNEIVVDDILLVLSVLWIASIG